MANNNAATSAAGVGEGPALLRKYKPDQGKYTRLGTAVGAGALIAWGAYYLSGRLTVFVPENSPALNNLITVVIPLVFALVLGALTWWGVYSNQKSSDFLIATEGEMKKVNWSTRREIIGSTKVVILFTALLSAFLFLWDFIWQQLFSAINILRT